MATSNDTSFVERFQDSCPDRVSQLRRAIQGDVKETDGQIIHMRTYNKYSISLPPLVTFPEEFRNMFKDKFNDLDMQDDLERTDVINWCRTTKPLSALRTTADGNCLMHAVSQGLWGIEDTDLFLRRLLYVNLATDPRGVFQKRWMFHQRNSSNLNQFEVRMNTVECTEEWESVIKATNDCARSQSHGLPYTALESFHLYVTANILRRPIIVLADSMARTVYGETIQESQISGIYFPLEWPPEECNKNPLVIGYNMNHFAPLLFEDDSQTNQNDVTIRAIPLASKDMDSIPARFLMPNEEANYANILKSYLYTTEVFHGTTSIPAAKVTLVQIHETVNIVDACRSDCERKFRRLIDEDQEIVVQPFNFQTEKRVMPAQNIAIPPDVNMVPQRSQKSQNVRRKPERRRCGTIGCEHFANPEMQNLCSKCFNDFTIQYHRQEEAAKKANQLKKPQFGRTDVSTRHQSNAANFHDLSMMGEDCHAGCGFKCSTETYPYCHECYPKFVDVSEQRVQEEPMQQLPDMSMMPDNCRNCAYKCSRATFPYCHECFPKFINPLLPVPTAPPQSVSVIPNPEPPAAHGPFSIVTQPSDETEVASNNRVLQPSTGQPFVKPTTGESESQIEPMDVQVGSGELNRKCRTLHCNNAAIKGNNGFCDGCYQLNLFGGGATPVIAPTGESALMICKNPGCHNPSVPEKLECLGCLQKGDGQNLNLQVEARSENTAMNIIPTPEEKILNSGSAGAKRQPNAVFSLSGASMRSMPAEHDETAVQTPAVAALPKINPHREEERQPTSSSTRKYICATAGCEGIRTDNEYGFCFSCLNKSRDPETGLIRPQSRSNLDDSVPYASGTPVELTEKLKNELAPVVKSSKDKVKCASPACTTLIYPPKKLCDSCKDILEKHQAKRSRDENRKSVGLGGAQCISDGCTFFGTPQFNGFCSSCYKALAPRSRYTAPLLSRPAAVHNAEQIPAGAPIQQETRHTAPILLPKAKLCIEPGCTRYGDPSQRDRCSYHYQLATALFLPMSPASLEQNRLIIAQQQSQQPNQNQQPRVNRQQTTSGSSGHRPTKQEEVRHHDHGGASQIAIGSSSVSHIQNGNPGVNTFEESYNRLFTSKRHGKLCKNNASTGCNNFGNSSKGGYCNTCYPQVQLMAQSRTNSATNSAF